MKIKYWLVSILSVILISFGFNTAASAKTIPFDAQHNNLGSGNEVILKKPTKVSFVNIKYTTNQGVKATVVQTKVLAKGTKLYGFYKGTEGVDLCMYNFKAGVPITKNAWPSVVLNNKNAKVLHKYKTKYSFDYTMKHILHEKD